jgi:hypothetical protein
MAGIVMALGFAGQGHAVQPRSLQSWQSFDGWLKDAAWRRTKFGKPAAE